MPLALALDFAFAAAATMVCSATYLDVVSMYQVALFAHMNNAAHYTRSYSAARNK